MHPSPKSLQCVSVTNDGAEAFFIAIEYQLEKMSCEDLLEVRLFSTARPGIAISFDAERHQFLGFTAGGNSIDDRAHLLMGTQILKQIGEILASWNYDTQGGRVFITQDSATRVIDDLPHTICIWEWEGDGPETRVSEIYARIKQDGNCR